MASLNLRIPLVCILAVSSAKMLSAQLNILQSETADVKLAQTETRVKFLLGATNGIVQSGINEYSAGEQGRKLCLFEIHLSNLGVVPIPTSYGSLSLRQLWGPGVLVGFKGEQTLGISTLNGQLCLLHASHSPLPCLLEQIESTLKLACTS